jgi:hypothetical protein
MVGKLTELPAFLSTVSMVFDDQELTIEKLFKAEHPSPAFYDPARKLFCSVLSGDFSFSKAIEQAEKLTEATQRNCAVDILVASKDFLSRQEKSRVTRIDASTRIPNGMQLKVAPIWVRELDKPRLLVLHFWRTALTDFQIGAAAAILKHSFRDRYAEFSNYELDFVSIPESPIDARRNFRCLDWNRARPLDEFDLTRFWKQFVSAWDTYQKRPGKLRRGPKRSGPRLL